MIIYQVSISIDRILHLATSRVLTLNPIYFGILTLPIAHDRAFWYHPGSLRYSLTLVLASRQWACFSSYSFAFPPSASSCNMQEKKKGTWINLRNLENKCALKYRFMTIGITPLEAYKYASLVTYNGHWRILKLKEGTVDVHTKLN